MSRRLVSAVAVLCALVLFLPGCILPPPPPGLASASSGTASSSSTMPPAPSSVPTPSAPAPSAPAPSEAEPEPYDGVLTRFPCAFGMFSVELPMEVQPFMSTGDFFGADELYLFELEDSITIIRANYATVEDYDQRAGLVLDSLISYMYAFSGGQYSESEVKEAALLNGYDLRWQIMRGELYKSMWMEVFSKNYGFNLCIWGDAALEDAAFDRVARSFQANTIAANKWATGECTKGTGGQYVTADNALNIQTDYNWGAMGRDPGPSGTVLSLGHYNMDMWIQLMRTGPSTPVAFETEGSEEAREEFFEYFNALIDWTFSAPAYANTPRGEIKSLRLENLGVEAYTMEVLADDEMYNKLVGFEYGGYTYYGAFMWMEAEDAEYRGEMEAVLASLGPSPFVQETYLS